jgi:hypothetical protein
MSSAGIARAFRNEYMDEEDIQLLMATCRKYNQMSEFRL